MEITSQDLEQDSFDSSCKSKTNEEGGYKTHTEIYALNNARH